MARNILLLTGTVRPPAGMPALTRTDWRVRLDDYARGLRFYLPLLGTTFDAIVFAENSASDLSLLKDLVREAKREDRVEFVSFYGLDHPPSYGRGYGEFKLVDHAMAHSAFLGGDGDEERVVWKCTGRYRIKNLEQIVRDRPRTFDIYCHMRNYRYKLCELYLIAWNRKGYEAAIKGVYPRLRNDTQGYHIIEETLFRTWIEGLRGDLRVVPRFRHVPLIEGIRAWNNTPYSDRPWHGKILVRRFALNVLPWLWI
jgi:hypothetical protein